MLLWRLQGARRRRETSLVGRFSSLIPGPRVPPVGPGQADQITKILSIPTDKRGLIYLDQQAGRNRGAPHICPEELRTPQSFTKFYIWLALPLREFGALHPPSCTAGRSFEQLLEHLTVQFLPRRPMSSGKKAQLDLATAMLVGTGSAGWLCLYRLCKSDCKGARADWDGI